MPRLIATKYKFYDFSLKNALTFILNYKSIIIKTNIYFFPVNNIIIQRRTYTTLNLYNNIKRASTFKMVRDYIDKQFKKEFNPFTGCVKETLKTNK